MQSPISWQSIIAGSRSGVEQAAADFAFRMRIPLKSGRPIETTTRATPMGDLEAHQADQPSLGETAKHILEADGTLIITQGQLGDDLKWVQDYAGHHELPCLHVNLERTSAFSAAREISVWVVRNRVRAIHITGPTEASTPGLYGRVSDLLGTAFYMCLVGPDPTELLPPTPAAPLPSTQTVPGSLAAALDWLIDRIPFRERVRIARAGRIRSGPLAIAIQSYLRNQLNLPDSNDALVRDCESAAGQSLSTRTHLEQFIIDALIRSLQTEYGMRRVK